MPVRYLIAACLAFLSLSAVARDVGKDEQEIRRVDALVCNAFREGDAKTLRANLDKRFTLVSSAGVLTDLEANLAEVMKRDPYYDEFRDHDQSVRVYGDAAIVNGITSIRGTSGGEAFSADFEFTDTYIYRDGRWLLAASHASRLKK